MSLPAHVKVIGKEQGEVKGSCDMTGREGTIFVDHVSHKIALQKGESYEGRVHHPLCITKRLDIASPKLHQALVKKEILQTVEVFWYRIDETGHEEHYYTHKLEDALVTDIETDMEVEKVYFSYSKISWIHTVAAIESSDEWV